MLQENLNLLLQTAKEQFLIRQMCYATRKLNLLPQTAKEQTSLPISVV